MPQKIAQSNQNIILVPYKLLCAFCFQVSPMEPGAGSPPTHGTDNDSPPSYDEATGWSL